MQLTLHTDNGHGWLFVSNTALNDLGLARESFSQYSFHDTSGVYAEEDRDAGIVLNAMECRGYAPNCIECHLEGEHWIRQLPRC